MSPVLVLRTISVVAFPPAGLLITMLPTSELVSNVIEVAAEILALLIIPAPERSVNVDALVADFSVSGELPVLIMFALPVEVADRLLA